MPPVGARFWLICRARPSLLRRVATIPIAPPRASGRPFTRLHPQLRDKSVPVAPSAEGDDPLDTSDLQDGIHDALDRLRDKIAGLRAGGRFDPQLVEDLRVTVNKKQAATAKLADLAQVIPKRGRSLAVIVGQEEVRFSNPTTGFPCLRIGALTREAAREAGPQCDHVLLILVESPALGALAVGA